MRIKIDDREIDIEPHASDETPHFYVTITAEDGEVYEGRIYQKPIKKVKDELAEEIMNIFRPSMQEDLLPVTTKLVRVERVNLTGQMAENKYDMPDGPPQEEE